MSDVPIREHFRERLDLEQQVRDERQAAYRTEQDLLAQQCKERWDAHERQHRLEARALELQAREYERRLSDLNHAHQQAQDVQGTYLPREVYESQQRESDVKINNLEKWQSNFMGRMVVTGGVVAVISSLLSGAVVGIVARLLTR